MKKLISIIVTALTLSLAVCTAAFAKDLEITISIDGEPLALDAQPIVVNDRTLVPMRCIFEGLGATVKWDDETKSVYSISEGLYVKFTINSTRVFKNGTDYYTDVCPILYNGYTYVPVRAASEGMGATVEWNAESKHINITKNTKINTKYDDKGNIVYQGEIENNLANGYGILFDTSNNEISYWGQFKNNEACGQGTRYFADGAYIYGEFRDNLPNGKCTLVKADNTAIVGDFVNGNIGGSQVGIYNSNGNLIYIGTVNNDYEPQGIGEKYDPQTGDLIYQGYFTNGLYDGQGTSYDLDGSVIYSGIWCNGMTQKDAEIYNLRAYGDELNALNAEYQNRMLELTKLRLTDPLTTDWGKSILDYYMQQGEEDGEQASKNAASSASSNGGNIDSFAAANARRARQTELNMAKAMGIEAVQKEHKARIELLEAEIELWYKQNVNMLKVKYGIRD